MAEPLRNANGAEVCPRSKDVAVENIAQHPESGFHYEKRICSRPLTLSISENRKVCPDCERPAPVGNVHPRTINSRDIRLTQKELSECGVKEDVVAVPVAPKRAPRKPRELKPAVEAKVSKNKKDCVVIEIDLVTMEKTEDIAALLIRLASNGLNDIPVTNFGESKRLIKLQEKLESLLEA